MGHTGVGLCEVGWVMLGWGGSLERWGGSYRGRLGWVIQQSNLKDDSPQHQDLTSPKSFLKGVKIQILNIIIINYYYFIITIVLYFQLYQNIITRCSLYKNPDGMIITLVQTDKSRKVACVLNGTEMLSTKATTKKKHAFSHIIQKAVDNNFSEEKTEYLTCNRSNYSVKIFTAHSKPV